MTDTIHDKIRKLLALGSGKANDHEAEQAMRLAHRLMMQHGVSEDQLQTSEQKARIIESGVLELDLQWHYNLAHAASVLLGVRYFLRPRQGIFFVGRADNVKAAQETLAFLMLQVEQFYKEGLPKGLSKTARATFRKEFKVSASSQVYQRAKRLVEESTPATSGTDLVIFQHREKLEAEIEDHISSWNLGKSKARRTSYKNPEAWAAGRVAGDSIDLHRKVS